MSGCNGGCCEKFTIPFSMEEIKQRADKKDILNGDPREIFKLLEMLIPVEKSSDGLGTKGHWYTCKYFDKETRRCMNYENRPVVCKQHPTDRPCSIKGCTEPMTQRCVK